MNEIVKEKEEVIIIGQSGTKTLMPSFEFAKQRATGLWKGAVKKIEVKTTYLVADKKLFKESLDNVNFEITQLESDRNNVGSEDVIRFIESELQNLYREKKELEYSLEVINKN